MTKSVTGALLLAASVEAETSQAFIFRHCLRMSGNEAKRAHPDFTLLSDYTAHPLPEWGVPENWCTFGGMEAAAASGADLKANFDVNPRQLSITADITMRDGDTATAVLHGLEAAASVEIDPILYSTSDPEVGEPVCQPPDEATNYRDVAARFAEVPLPWDLESAIDDFEKVFGVGRAGSLKNLVKDHNINTEGKLTGPVNVMKELSQNLLYSYGSNIHSYLNGTQSYEQAAKFYAWQAWARSIGDVGAEKAIETSYLLSRTLDDLLKPGHSALHFGHDGNMDAFVAYLDLSWEAPPFMGGQLLPTPPNSAIRLVHNHEEHSVTASFIYLNFAKGENRTFSESPIKSWDTSEFLELAMQNLVKYSAKTCFDQAVKSEQLSALLSKVSAPTDLIV